VLVVTVGVHCVDVRGCVPPQDHTPSAAEDDAWVAGGACRPAWSCCSWDDGQPGLEDKALAELVEPTDGPSGFVEVAAPGSWLALFPQAGHLSFLEPGSFVPGTGSCPSLAQPGAVLRDASALVAAFFNSRLRGRGEVEPLTLGWASRQPGEHLRMSLKAKDPAA
jgi:hypothetical protein